MKYTGYIILSCNKETKKIKGYSEHSFSMAFETYYVRLWRVYEYYGYGANRTKIGAKQRAVNDMKEMVENLSKKYPNEDIKYFRVGSKHCPVKIDHRFHGQVRSKKVKPDTFLNRNPKFFVKDTVKFDYETIC